MTSRISLSGRGKSPPARLSSATIRRYPLCGARSPATPREGSPYNQNRPQKAMGLWFFSRGKAVPLFEGDVGIFLKEEVFADRGSPPHPLRCLRIACGLSIGHLLQTFNAIRC